MKASMLRRHQVRDRNRAIMNGTLRNPGGTGLSGSAGHCVASAPAHSLQPPYPRAVGGAEQHQWRKNLFKQTDLPMAVDTRSFRHQLLAGLQLGKQDTDFCLSLNHYLHGGYLLILFLLL